MISEIIKNRRAVFPAQYNKEEITKQELQTVLEAANWAPTHRRTEPWRFKVLQGASKESLGFFLSEKYKETAINFSEFKFNKYKNTANASGAVIAICMQRDLKEAIPEWEEIAATAMAVQNMWLTAHELKIGAYWSSPSVIAYMDQFFDLNEREHCLGFFYMGKYDGELPEGIRQTPISEKTEWL